MGKFFSVAILIYGLIGAAVEAKKSKQSLLRQTVFEGYDNLVKPDETISVYVGLSLLNLETCPHKQVSLGTSWVRVRSSNACLAK